MRTTLAWLLVASLSGCGDDDRERGNTDGALACTPEDQAVQGTSLEVTPVWLDSFEGQGNDRLLVSDAEVLEVFPDGDAPTLLAEADFTVDRVVLGSSNPALQFAVDDGTRLIVGEEPLCQGAAPSSVAYIIHGTTQEVLEVATCAYRGPYPCLAP